MMEFEIDSRVQPIGKREGRNLKLIQECSLLASVKGKPYILPS